MRRVLVSVTACLLATSTAHDARADTATRGIQPEAKPVHFLARTRQSRTELSAFLVESATRATKANDYARAIPLYRALVIARGLGSPEAKELATLWTKTGQFELAARAWRDYAAHTPEASEREPALKEAALAESKLGNASTDKLVLVAMTAEANRAFTSARRAVAAKHDSDAIVLFYMGFVLAPESPNYIRDLAAAIDRWGENSHVVIFFHEYLAERPIGPNADLVRKLLGVNKYNLDALGTLTISSSLPCTEVWINRQRLTKLPTKGILVTPGTYKGLCFSPKHEMALFEYATVEGGKATTMTFRWAIVENRLENPLGRITLENPKSPGTMIDLGITSRDIGVAAPADNRKLEMVLRDDTGTRTERRQVQVVPGQRLVVRW